jgi:NAD(P)-dependent dehydrogenase (short-subunit alcohol dehydrogenase family)
LNNFLNELYDLEDKVAFVIGAGGHICGDLALGLYKAGCKIVIADLRQENIDKYMIQNNFDDQRILSFQMDATKKAHHQLGLKKCLKEFGSVDILINGAGINSPVPFFDITENDWMAVMNSQINATFLGCQVFGEQMIKQKNGSIINISSASAGPPLSKAFAYSSAKAAIKNLTQNLGREWGTSGVRVNAIRPGFFPTQWNIKNFLTEDRIESIMKHTPMKRFGDPVELVGAVLWLSSAASSFVTGAEISVDGGFSAMSI